MLLKTGSVISITSDEIELEQRADPVATIAFGGALLDEGDDLGPLSITVAWNDVLIGDYRVAHSI